MLHIFMSIIDIFNGPSRLYSQYSFIYIIGGRNLLKTTMCVCAHHNLETSRDEREHS